MAAKKKKQREEEGGDKWCKGTQKKGKKVVMVVQMEGVRGKG